MQPSPFHHLVAQLSNSLPMFDNTSATAFAPLLICMARNSMNVLSFSWIIATHQFSFQHGVLPLAIALISIWESPSKWSLWTFMFKATSVARKAAWTSTSLLVPSCNRWAPLNRINLLSSLTTTPALEVPRFPFDAPSKLIFIHYLLDGSYLIFSIEKTGSTLEDPLASWQWIIGQFAWTSLSSFVNGCFFKLWFLAATETTSVIALSTLAHNFSSDFDLSWKILLFLSFQISHTTRDEATSHKLEKTDFR